MGKVFRRKGVTRTDKQLKYQRSELLNGTQLTLCQRITKLTTIRKKGFGKHF